MTRDSRIALSMVGGGIAGALIGLGFFASLGWIIGCAVLGVAAARLVSTLLIPNNKNQ